MTKVPNLPSLTGQYLSTTQVNAAFEAIEEAFENTLSLDGSTPNSMQADLDMDSNDILNAKRIEAKTIVVDGVDVRDLLDDLPGLLNGTYTEYVAIYDGDGTSSPLTLPLSVDDPDRLLVIVNGSVVRPDYDYTVSNFSVFPTGDLSVWPHGEKNITIRLKREVDFAVIQDSDINSNGFPLSSVLSAGGPGTTRALLVSLVAAGWNPAVGTVVQAADLSYRRESGATAIADLPGWVPHGGPVSPLHFGSDPGNNDALALLTAAAAWLVATRSNTDKNAIDLGGRIWRISDTWDIPNIGDGVIRNGGIRAIGTLAGWAETDAGLIAELAAYETVTAAGKTWLHQKPLISGCLGNYVEFEDVVLDGNRLAAGIRPTNSVWMRGSNAIKNFRTYGTWTRYKQGKINCAGRLLVQQTAAGAEAIPDRDGYCVIDGNIDTKWTGLTACYAHCVLMTFGGTSFFDGCDIFNGLGFVSDVTTIAGEVASTDNIPVDTEIGAIWRITQGTPETTDDIFVRVTSLTPLAWEDVTSEVVLPTANPILWEHWGNSTVNWSAGRLGNGEIFINGSGVTIDNAKVGYTSLVSLDRWIRFRAHRANADLSRMQMTVPQLPRRLWDGSTQMFSMETRSGTSWSASIVPAKIEAMFGHVNFLPRNTVWFFGGIQNTVCRFETASVNGAFIRFRDGNTTVATDNSPSIGALGDVGSLRSGGNNAAADRLRWSTNLATDAVWINRTLTVENISSDTASNPTFALSGGRASTGAGNGVLGRIEVRNKHPDHLATHTIEVLANGATAWTHPTRGTVRFFPGLYTVAQLPTAANAGAGARCFVTDANATTFASVVAGGGSNFVPVYSDGTNWRIG